jgi:fructose-1,6-bisphosphatase/inositol monophosphatase family enzyme
LRESNRQISLLTAVEADVLRDFRSHSDSDLQMSGDRNAAWLYFTLNAALETCAFLRELRGSSAARQERTKSDDTPTVAGEKAIEENLRSLLQSCDATAVLVGEETGGTLPQEGYALAVDPIDGTWAFLADTESYATALTIYSDGNPLVGVVANPVTGEIGHAVLDGEARLLQLAAFGEPDASRQLPLNRPTNRPILVHLQATRESASLQDVVLNAWRSKDVRLVRSAGGSPAWALVEAARGHFTYVNPWKGRSAEPWDLSAGGLILRAAGGDVVDLNGKSISLVGHTGPFVAGIEEGARNRVIHILAGI